MLVIFTCSADSGFVAIFGAVDSILAPATGALAASIGAAEMLETFSTKLRASFFAASESLAAKSIISYRILNHQAPIQDNRVFLKILKSFLIVLFINDQH